MKYLVLAIIITISASRIAAAVDSTKTPCTTPSLQEYEKLHPGVMQLNKQMKQPELTRRVEVRIPDSLKKTTEKIGTTILVAVLNTKGLLNDICILRKSEKREWDTAAIDAVSKWKYRPAKKDGTVIAVFIVVTVRPHYR